MNPTLGGSERRQLLLLALGAILDKLGQPEKLEQLMRHAPAEGGLVEARGAFVSLKIDDSPGVRRLRGCIGRIESSDPLFRTVIDTARLSAFQDPRFSPVTIDELDRISLEVSALTPLRALEHPSEVQPGRDGVQFKLDGHASVFLPQVAAERGWNREKLLRQLSLKAGLDREAWRKAELQVFQAEVFGESVAALG